MSTGLTCLAVLLLLSIAVGLYRVLRGPTAADAMLAALLMGTTGTAITLLLGSVLQVSGAVDVALTLALLSAVIGVAFVGSGWPENRS